LELIFLAITYKRKQAKISLSNNYHLENKWFEFLNSDVGPSGESNKLRLYAALKSCLNIEPYLVQLSNPFVRSQITKLRISAHHLAVESGRGKKKKTNIKAQNLIHRVCKQCDESKVENEYHFLMECPPYEEIRLKLYNSISMTALQLSKKELFLDILKCEDSENQEAYSLFINEMFNHRKNIISHVSSTIP